MADEERRNNRRFPETKQHFACFCFGFTWSTVLALAAFLLCQIYFFKSELTTNKNRCERRIIGTYRLSDNREVTSEQLSKLTHLNFASIHYLANGLIGFSSFDEKARLEKVNAKAKLSRVKTMFTLELADRQSKNISGVLQDPVVRKTLIQSISSFIQQFQLDGVNLSVESPLNEQEQLFVETICKEIREELNELQFSTNREDSYLLSLVCQREVLRLDYDKLFKYVNFLNIETDNFYSPWLGFPSNTMTGSPTPLYSGHGVHSSHNLDTIMQYFSCETKRPNRLNIMTVFGGRLWKNVILPTDSSETLWMTVEDNRKEVEGNATEWRDYSGGSALWNDESKTAYIWNQEERLYHAFENKRSFEEKIKYVVEKNIGGIAIASITADDDNLSLLNVVASDRFCLGKSDKKVNYDCNGI